MGAWDAGGGRPSLAGAQALPGARPACGRLGRRLGARLGDRRRPLRPPVARPLALHDRLPAPHCAERGGAACRCCKRPTASGRWALPAQQGRVAVASRAAHCPVREIARPEPGQTRLWQTALWSRGSRRATGPAAHPLLQLAQLSLHLVADQVDARIQRLLLVLRPHLGRAPLRLEKAAQPVPVWPPHSVHVGVSSLCPQPT
jgi:hypothetical protein